MAGEYRFGHWGPTSEEILTKQFPLHRACRDGDLEALSLLLVEAQHGIYEEDNFYGWTPAHWASYFGKLNCLMHLLENGMDADVSSIRLNQTSMHIAAFAGRGHCVKWLLHCGAKIDRQLACLRKLMTTSIRENVVNCNLRTSRFRQTPAHLAAFGGHPQCLLWLVSAKADLDLQDYLGETPLHKAARTGSMECISLLVSHGARLYIRNNNNQLAVQLSSSCVHQEVTRYLEQARQCQAPDSVGVYSRDPSPHAITTPSPHDITSATTSLPQHPCVVVQGLNGGRLPPPGPQNDCPMDEEESGAIPPPAAATAEGPVTDITTHRGVSANLVSIGGKKRSLEEYDEIDHKRRRSDFSLGYNGLFTNGDCEPGVALSEQCSQTVMSQKAANGLLPVTSQNCQPVVLEQGVYRSRSLSEESLEYAVGYDYSGITQCQLDEEEGTHSESQMQMVESPVVSESRNGWLPAKLAPAFWQMHPTFHSTPTQQHTFLAETLEPIASPPPQKQDSDSELALSTCSSPLVPGWQQCLANSGPGMFGPAGEQFNYGRLLSGQFATSSLTDHQNSVMVAQGYDSLMHETMLVCLH